MTTFQIVERRIKFAELFGKPQTDGTHRPPRPRPIPDVSETERWENEGGRAA